LAIGVVEYIEKEWMLSEKNERQGKIRQGCFSCKETTGARMGGVGGVRYEDEGGRRETGKRSGKQKTRGNTNRGQGAGRRRTRLAMKREDRTTHKNGEKRG